MRPVIFLAVVTSLVAAAPSDSDACGPPPCWLSFFTPESLATVPANLPAFHWQPMSGSTAPPPDPDKVILTKYEAPVTPLPLIATKLMDGNYLLTPLQPLTPGTIYNIADVNTCDGFTGGKSSLIQVVDAAPLPSSLGVLTVTWDAVGPLTVATSSGSCSSEVEAHQLSIDLQLSADAMPWRDALQFTTYVDGRVWRAARSANSAVPPGSSWRGRGLDLLYQVCKTEDESIAEGLTAGMHSVVMTATAPGTGFNVASTPLTVHLDCNGASDKDEGGGCAAGPPGSSGWLLLGPLAALFGLRRRTARHSA